MTITEAGQKLESVVEEVKNKKALLDAAELGVSQAQAAAEKAVEDAKVAVAFAAQVHQEVVVKFQAIQAEFAALVSSNVPHVSVVNKNPQKISL